MRQVPGCPACTCQIASHNSLAVPPTLPAVMQEADRAQLSPCDPACALNSVLTATFILNGPVGLSGVTGGTRFTQQNWALQEENLSYLCESRRFLPTMLYFWEEKMSWGKCGTANWKVGQM